MTEEQISLALKLTTLNLVASILIYLVCRYKNLSISWYYRLHLIYYIIIGIAGLIDISILFDHLDHHD